MAVKNLELPIFHYTNPETSTPAAGWLVNVYAAGTTNRINTWQDSSQGTLNDNPVVLDSYGNAKIWFDQSAKIVVTDASGDGTYGFTFDNISPSGGQSVVYGNENLILNGSFESGTGSTVSNWTLTPYSGASIAVDTTNVTHGLQALKFDGASGVGGGTATSARFPVTADTMLSISFDTMASNATTTNDIIIYWYQKDDSTPSAVSSSTTVALPAEGSYPTSMTNYSFLYPVPSDATRAYIEITGIDSGGSNLDQDVWFDNFVVKDNQGIAVASTSTPITYLKVAAGATGVNPSVAAEGEADTGVTIKDSNGNEIIAAESTASAVTYAKVTNNIAGNGPTYSVDGETNVDINVASKGNGNVNIDAPGSGDIVLTSTSGSIKTDTAITAETTNGDVDFTRNGTGEINVDSIPIYGFVLLDEPELLVTNSSTTTVNWTTFDMSAGGTEAAAAATAGARKAILKLKSTISSSLTTSAGNMYKFVYLGKSGYSGAPSGVTEAQYLQEVKESTGLSVAANIAIDTVMVNLDSNSDFQYGINFGSGLAINSSSTSIYLVGYYV